MLEDGAPYGDPFAAGIPWYDENGQFLPHISSGFGFGYDLSAITVPVVPQVTELEHRVLNQDTLVKTFYEGPKKSKDPKDDTINWVEKEPIQVPEAVEDRYNQAAIRIYKAKDRSAEKTFGGVTAMRVEFIKIQSLLLMTAIESILVEVGLRPADKKMVTIDRPFKELYFAYPSISALAQRQHPHTDLGIHLNVLLKVMDELLSEMSQAISGLQTRKEISYEYLWTLFPKDIIVYSRKDEQDRLYQVTGINRDAGGIEEIACQFVQFDGTIFGTRSTTLGIRRFTGARPISELSVYPIGFHPDANLEKRLAERGRQVLGFQDVCYQEYSGVGKTECYGEYYEEEEMEHYVTGRIIVDAFGFGKFNPDKRITVTAIKPAENNEPHSNSKNESSSGDDSEKGRPSLKEQQRNKNEIQATRQHLLLMSPMLAGYSLTLKKWLWLSVDHVRALSWNEDAYDHLVFPADQKALLLSFVKNHKQSSKETDDVIAGKGKPRGILASNTNDIYHFMQAKGS